MAILNGINVKDAENSNAGKKCMMSIVKII